MMSECASFTRHSSFVLSYVPVRCMHYVFVMCFFVLLFRHHLFDIYDSVISSNRGRMSRCFLIFFPFTYICSIVFVFIFFFPGYVLR